MAQTPGPSTGVFYAYAKTIIDDCTARFLITFATRDIADTWFRAITDSVAKGYNKFASFKRISIQFYSFDHHVCSIMDTLKDSKVAPALHDRVFITLLNDRDGRIISMVPVLNYTEHINGSSFYIRSVAHPDTYWYYDASSETVVAHQSRRSQFTIKIADDSRGPGTIIIGSDEIYITTTSGVNVGVANRENHLSYSANPSPLKFSSFGNRDFQIASWEDDRHPNIGPLAHKPGQGERWELL
ncbi:hypothetical protein FRB94_001368 [Tulasnella sp. JGI-2019a]|nr:hypothetical protein FRB93_008688 [Tulasnella sp. JGI-2019a]KAG8987895.1 hypothetical protein FRB94_001368 [Tulasnella sp. JGI-2019a]KAG9026746.1 hypothetical protein FRB95_008518 [Tulasnella sp. JGI-2019a]